MLRKFNPDGFAASPNYSHVAEATAIGRMVFVSGQIGTRADGSIPPTIDDQADLVFGKIEAALAATELSFRDVAKLTIFLTDATLLASYRAVAQRYLPSPPPASSLVFVKGLILPELLVEIEAVAAR